MAKTRKIQPAFRMVFGKKNQIPGHRKHLGRQGQAAYGIDWPSIEFKQSGFHMPVAQNRHYSRQGFALKGGDEIARELLVQTGVSPKMHDNPFASMACLD
ncbi:hypothetical protein [Thalassospira povalilytica]|uniref:hypothetical protein n=1 Tax=Thalassospira povalilytica TaxID=732237 RepID=UPI003AA9208A